MRPSARAAILFAAATLFLAGCAQVNPYYDASKPHHRPQGFANNYPNNPDYQPPRTGFFQGLAGRMKNWTSDGSERLPLAPIGQVTPDLDFIQGNPVQPALTWIGHASFLLQSGAGLNILTDPIFDERASPVSFAGPKRHQPPGIALNQLPHIDAILISHSHYDHLSLDSLRALYRQKGGPPMLYVPLGIDLWLVENVTNGDRSRIVRLDWWDQATLGGHTLQLLPVHHWSARGLYDRNRTLWGGWAVTRPGFSFFFSGDLGYSKDIQDIAARYPEGFDLAAIGIGAYQPVWYRNSHVSPDEAVRIHRELRVRRSIGMHWGTYPMGQERLDQAPRDLAIARQAQGVSEDAFGVLRIGETWRVPLRETSPTAGSLP